MRGRQESGTPTLFEQRLQYRNTPLHFSRDTLEAAGNASRVYNERSLDLKGLGEPVTVATVDWSDG